MSTQERGEGLAEVFVKGAVFTLGAAAAGLVLRRLVHRDPEVVVVAVAADELDDDQGDDVDARANEGTP